MNSTIIDVIFIIFFVIMAIFGYIKGFITRLYDFLGTIIVLFLSYWLCKPVSSLFVLYQYDQTDIISTMIGSMVNQVLIFFVLLIILFVIKKILGIIIKPLLKSISEKFSLTSDLDHILGIVLSLVEATLISYIAVILLITPIYTPGKAMIDQTLIAKHVLDFVPSITQQVQNFNTDFENLYNSQQSVESLTQIMLTAHKLGLIDDEQLLNVFSQQLFNEIQNNDISLTSTDKEKVKELLKKSHYDQSIINDILSNINVSDENENN